MNIKFTNKVNERKKHAPFVGYLSINVCNSIDKIDFSSLNLQSAKS